MIIVRKYQSLVSKLILLIVSTSAPGYGLFPRQAFASGDGEDIKEFQAEIKDKRTDIRNETAKLADLNAEIKRLGDCENLDGDDEFGGSCTSCNTCNCSSDDFAVVGSGSGKVTCQDFYTANSDLSSFSASCKGAITHCGYVKCKKRVAADRKDVADIQRDLASMKSDLADLNTQLEEAKKQCPNCGLNTGNGMQQRDPTTGELIIGGLQAITPILGMGLSTWMGIRGQNQYYKAYNNQLQQCATIGVPCQGPSPLGFGLGGGGAGFGGFGYGMPGIGGGLYGGIGLGGGMPGYGYGMPGVGGYGYGMPGIGGGLYGGIGLGGGMPGYGYGMPGVGGYGYGMPGIGGGLYGGIGLGGGMPGYGYGMPGAGGYGYGMPGIGGGLYTGGGYGMPGIGGYGYPGVGGGYGYPGMGGGLYGGGGFGMPGIGGGLYAGGGYGMPGLGGYGYPGIGGYGYPGIGGGLYGGLGAGNGILGGGSGFAGWGVPNMPYGAGFNSALFPYGGSLYQGGLQGSALGYQQSQFSSGSIMIAQQQAYEAQMRANELVQQNSYGGAGYGYGGILGGTGYGGLSGFGSPGGLGGGFSTF